MTEPPAGAPPPQKYRSGGSIALIVIGLLILVPSGLCTGFLGIGTLVEALSHPLDRTDQAVLEAALLFGGVPFLIGVILFVLGLRMKPK